MYNITVTTCFFFKREQALQHLPKLRGKKKTLIIAFIIENNIFPNNWMYRVCFIALITQASENEACLAGQV